jgi:hypothetical protein
VELVTFELKAMKDELDKNPALFAVAVAIVMVHVPEEEAMEMPEAPEVAKVMAFCLLEKVAKSEAESTPV